MVQKISGNLFRKNFGQPLRLSFFLEICKVRKFSVPFDISTRHESAPVPLVVPESCKTAASRYYTGCKTICYSPSLLSSSKTLGSAFLKNCGLFVPKFPWAFAGLHNLPQEKFASLFYCQLDISLK